MSAVAWVIILMGIALLIGLTGIKNTLDEILDVLKERLPKP